MAAAPTHVRASHARRPAKQARPTPVTWTSRRLVRPAFVAAAAVTVAIVVGVPTGYESGLLPVDGLGGSPVDVPSRMDPAVTTASGAASATPSPADAHRAEVTAPAPARPAAAGGAPAASRPSSRTASRSRRATKPPAPKEAAPGGEVPAAPIAEPLPVSPIADSAVLASTAPLVVSDRAEAVLAGPALELSQVDVRPEVQGRVAPRLPSHLGSRQVEDVVVLRVLVSPTGQASDVRVLRASKVDASLDDAAVAAVRQWRFTPAQKGGRPVSCWFSVGVPIRSGG